LENGVLLRKGEIRREKYEALMATSNCRDTNAGAFHMVLTNQIGLQDEGFIADVTRDLEVWNQAVQGFRSEIVEEINGASENAAPDTVREVVIETEMDYTVEIPHSFEGRDNYGSIATAYYRYRLELDKTGDIIGGEWLTKARPDFLWKQDLAEFSGFFKPLEKIYKASVK
jgi:hypothetical protein